MMSPTSDTTVQLGNEERSWLLNFQGVDAVASDCGRQAVLAQHALIASDTP
jgi:hypothetical protein